MDPGNGQNPASRTDRIISRHVLHYCTGNVEATPRQIRSIYEVVGVEEIEEDIQPALKKGKIDQERAEKIAEHPHLIRLERHLHLKKGLELPPNQEVG